ALDNEGKAIAASLGEKNSMMILDNHVIITTAESIEKAIYKHYYFEKAIENEVKTLATGQKIRQIPQEISKNTAEQFAR
ncbi:class II aldolase/adducin family protein, partial [Francisella tularensis]|uniref:class II aldolase/adducin family protein n=1 Tax=Francisella tularensis TaxID=263 RepID=UPI0023819800